MTIANYTRPQSTIKQELDTIPDAQVQRLNGVAIGPQYLLSRDGKEILPSSVVSDGNPLTATYQLSYFDESGVAIDVDNTKHIVDAASVVPVLKNAVATISTLTGAGMQLVDIATPSIMIATGGNLAGGTLLAGLNGRAVQVGDWFRYAATAGADRDRRITKLLGKETLSSYGSNAAKDDGLMEASVNNTDDSDAGIPDIISGAVSAPVGTLPLALFGTNNIERLPDGSPGDRLTYVCTTPGAAGVAVFNITSLSGQNNEFNAATTESVGNIVIGTSAVEVGDKTFTLGETFVLDVHAEAFTAEDGSAFTPAGTYTGLEDTTYTIRVVKSANAIGAGTGALLEISDTRAIDTRSTIAPTGNFSLGDLGITMTGDSGANLVKGDVFYIHAKAPAASTTEFDKIEVSGVAVDLGEVPDAITGFFGSIIFKGDIEIDNGITVVGSTVGLAAPTVDTGAGTALLLDEGTLSFNFRAVVKPGINEAPFAVGEGTTAVGTVDQENDLGYAVSRALAGAQGKAVFVVRTMGTTLADYQNALLRISRSDTYYAIAVCSEDLTVWEAVSAHVTSMSDETTKNFRRAYIGVDSPGAYKVHTEALTATVSLYDGEHRLVHVTGQPDIIAMGMLAGDTVKFTVDGTEFEVSSVLESGELILADALDSGYPVATTIELWRADNAQSQIDYLSGLGESFDNRRISLVWCEGGTTPVLGMAPEVVAPKFLAAEVAGLRSAVLPQRGLTRTEVETVTEAAPMFLRYTQEQLDEVAANGIFIITQDASDGPVYIRHQLTTDTNEGNLHYEDSIGVSFDNVSFGIKDVIDAYIGRYNGTAGTLAKIKEDVESVLYEGTKVALVNAEIGPALVEYRDLEVKLHPVLKDQFIVNATLVFPLPLNRGTVTLRGTWVGSES